MNKKVFGILIFLMMVLPIQTALGLPQNTDSINKKIIEAKNLDAEIIDMINRVNQSLISKYLEGLVTFGPRYTGTESCDEAAEYIYYEFKSMSSSIDVEYSEWGGMGTPREPIPHLKYFTSKNVVATINGANPESDAIFIICAHYDTTKTSPGANDDGSGVATMMAIASICSQYSFNHTLRFIAFSGEEVGTVGSHAYAKEAYDRGDNIKAVLNLETFGYTSAGSREFYILKTARTEWLSCFSQEITEKYNQFINLNLVAIGNRPCDHQAFLEYGYDAVQYVQLNRDDYPLHSPEDSLDKINYSYLVNVTRMILTIVAELAEKPINLQIRITTPYERCFYILDYPILRLPGFNIGATGLRGMTYILGSATVRVNITTTSKIQRVYFCIDGIADWHGECKEPPYEWKIRKSAWSNIPLKGKHLIGVYVVTEDGKTAYDEMDVFVFQLL